MMALLSITPWDHMRLFSRALLALLLAGPALADAGATAPIPRAQFAFHSGFLMNLHHFLFNLATHPDRMESWIRSNGLSSTEEAALRQALAFYRNSYAERDLLFDDTMTAIKRALSVDDSRRDPQGLGLAPGLADALRAAAPIYAAHAWSTEDAANRSWIAQVKSLDSRYGEDVQAAVERGLAGSFPRAPVRVDIVAETGKRQGAYTDSQAVIPAGRANYQGLASLEMLYHEAAHVQTTEGIERAIGARLKASGKSAESELWHVLQFHTVGAAVADAVRRRDGIVYVPYADKIGLSTGYWAPFQPLIERDWKPWLQGKESMEEAIQHMVAQLPDGL